MSTARRIAIIGDVHAQDSHLATVLEFLAKARVDKAYCVGDLVDGAGSAIECCRLLEEYHVETVLGNHDQWFLESVNRGVEHATQLLDDDGSIRSFLLELPKTIDLETPCGRTMICHGLGRHNMASVRPRDSVEEIYENLELWELFRDSSLKLIINGHTHRAGLRRFEHLTLVNAGSLTAIEEGCFVIVDLGTGECDSYCLRDQVDVHLSVSQQLY